MAGFMLARNRATDWLRSIIALKAFWYNEQAKAVDCFPGGVIRRYAWLPDTWPPSHMVVAWEGRLWCLINGTANTNQVYAHLYGQIGSPFGTGVVHSAWLTSAKNVLADIRPSIPPDAGTPPVVEFYGHSFGAAVAQVVAELRRFEGAGAGSQAVTAFASPRPFTHGFTRGGHFVELVCNEGDPAPFVPLPYLPVVYWDQFIGFIPLPDANFDGGWATKGAVRSIRTNGDIMEELLYLVHPSEPNTITGPAAHTYTSYLEAIQAVYTRRGWGYTAEEERLLGINRAVDALALQPRVWRTTTEIIGGPPDPLRVPGFFPGKPNNGGKMPAIGVLCEAYFRSGRYGWKEGMLYCKAGGPFTIDAAKPIHDSLMTERVKLGMPQVRYGHHFIVDACRYSVIDTDGTARETFLDHTVNFGIPPGADNPAAGTSVDFPFVGYLMKLKAGHRVDRPFMLRPLANVNFMDADAAEVANTVGATQATTWGALVVANPFWGIMAQDRASHPLKLVTAYNGAPPLIANTASLTVAAHGYGVGDQIRIQGGDPVHKVIRGLWRVTSVPTADTFIVDFGKPVPATLTPGVKVRKIVYGAQIIDTYALTGVRKRDTGRPLAAGRGRQ